MMVFKALTPKIIIVCADSQEELGRTFLRFQEHYESPEWRGKVFTIGQLRAWYAETFGTDSYERDWTGFNFPSYVLDAFKAGLFDPLTAEEERFLNAFRRRRDTFYVIGAQDDATLEHEVCHALYYTAPKYKAAVDVILRRLSVGLKPTRDYIKSLMYHPSVIADEVHAWTSASFDQMRDAGVDVCHEAHKELRNIRKRFKCPE